MSQTAILLYDGVCILCNKTIRFILRNEKNEMLRFAALESKASVYLLNRYAIPSDLNTVILIIGEKWYQQSDVIIHLAPLLQFPWSMSWLIRLIPKSLRDWFYNQIALKRYKIWGKYDQCPLPEKKYYPRFIHSIQDAQRLFSDR